MDCHLEVVVRRVGGICMFRDPERYASRITQARRGKALGADKNSRLAMRQTYWGNIIFNG
jgi:hypothetical protein